MRYNEGRILCSSLASCCPSSSRTLLAFLPHAKRISSWDPQCLIPRQHRAQSAPFLSLERRELKIQVICTSLPPCHPADHGDRDKLTVLLRFLRGGNWGHLAGRDYKQVSNPVGDMLPVPVTPERWTITPLGLVYPPWTWFLNPLLLTVLSDLVPFP
jgi:hypothetical protein